MTNETTTPRKLDRSIPKMYGSMELPKAELLQIVKQYALANYEVRGTGWHILVECHTDEEILEAMGRSKKVSGAIWAVEENLGLKVRGEVFDEQMSFGERLTSGEW